MRSLLSGLVWHRGGVADEQWCPEFYRRLAAVRAFRRMRRAALFRRLAYLCGLQPSRCGGSEREHPDGTADILIRSIVGMRSPDGSVRHSLTLLPGTSCEAWLRRYLAPNALGQLPLRVYWEGSSYYLEESGSALIVLEVLQAKRVLRVRAVLVGSLPVPVDSSTSFARPPRSSVDSDSDGCRAVRAQRCTAA